MNTHIKRYRTKHERRVVRTRARVANSLLPRLAVFRSNKYMFAQVIMPDGKAVAGVRHAEATKAGELLAEKAKKAGVEKVVFDRSGYKYHGRVKAVAEAARAGGLKF